jgi:hypothetical protein
MSITGKWYLVSEGTPEQPLPDHRVDLELEDSGGNLQGYLLSRVSAERFPLATCDWGGRSLRVPMTSPDGAHVSAILALNATDENQFLGRWIAETVPMMTLVRRVP